MSAQRTSESSEQHASSHVFPDPALMSQAKALRDSRQKRGLKKEDSWKAETLCDMSTMRELITFQPRKRYHAFGLHDDEAPVVNIADAAGADNAGAGNIGDVTDPLARPFQMVFASIDGSSGISLQDSGTLLQDTVVQNRSAKLCFLPDVSRGWRQQWQTAQQAQGVFHEVMIPDLASICIAYMQPYGGVLGMWQWLDSLVSEYCIETSFASHNGNQFNQEWLQGGGYLSLCRLDKELLSGAVEINIPCDDDGNLLFQLHNEQGDIIYRHTNYEKQLQAWNAEDAVYEQEHGYPRAPKITSETVLDLLKASQQVRLLFHYRGFGYGRFVHKVANFGCVTVLQLLSHSTSSSKSVAACTIVKECVAQ